MVCFTVNHLKLYCLLREFRLFSHENKFANYKSNLSIDLRRVRAQCSGRSSSLSMLLVVYFYFLLYRVFDDVGYTFVSCIKALFMLLAQCGFSIFIVKCPFSRMLYL